MGLMDTLRGLFGGKTSAVTEKAEQAIDTTADKANEATGGKFEGAVDTGAEKAKDVVSDAVEDADE